MMELVDRLDAWDRQAFLAINAVHSPSLDPAMALVSEMFTWFPLYTFLFFIIQQRHGWRGLAIAAPILALMILFSDKGSVMLFKENFQRLRPCHVPELQQQVHLIDGHCGGRFGFVSSHASNHFAIAMFMAGILSRRPSWAGPLLFLWAACVSYSRIYLGVHYPGDVLVGALYGILIGWLFLHLYRWIIARIERRSIAAI
jgi:undecaprenyl-diphosphatase